MAVEKFKSNLRAVFENNINNKILNKIHIVTI